MSHKTPTTERVKESLMTLGSVPADLAAATGYALVSALTLWFVGMASPLRAVVAVPLILFVPGYVLVAALYPGDGSARRMDLRGSVGVLPTDDGIYVAERILLSFGMSVALLPLIGGFVWATSGGFSLLDILFGYATFVIVTGGVAALRRTSLPADERFRVRLLQRLRRFRRWIVGRRTNETVVNLFLVGAVLVAAATFTYALAVPTSGESYTTAMLVTERNGEYVASGYPTTFEAGEPRSLTLQLTNHEGTETAYTVVVVVEDVERGGNDVSVVRQSELERVGLTLQPGETVRHDHAVSPNIVGENLRLSYYVYKGEAPETPRTSTAYRNLRLWISVSAAQ